MSKPQVDLIIATPGPGATTQYIGSLLNAAGKLNEKGISWIWLQDYASHVADAREITISGTRVNNPKETRPLMGELEYKKILWIDSDIGFSPEDVIKAYESELDVVSGGYLLGDGQVAVYPKMFKSGLRLDEAKALSQPIEIEGAGMGFFCMKSGIFEQLSRPWFQSVEGTTIYEGEEFTFPIMGEDLSLCKRIRDLGYKIWFDPSIKLVHQKTFKLTWDGIAP